MKVFFGLLCWTWLLQGCFGSTQNIEAKAAKLAIKASAINSSCGPTSACSGGLVCDYSYSQSTAGQGTCQQPCTNAGSNAASPCAANQICSPLTGTCQPSCTSSSVFNCSFLSQTAQQIASITCSSNTSTPGYCQLSGCPTIGASCNGTAGTLICKNITASVSGAAAAQVEMCVSACGVNGSCPVSGVMKASSVTGLVCDTGGSATGCLLNTCTPVSTGLCTSSPNSFICTANGYCEPQQPTQCTSNIHCTTAANPVCNRITGTCTPCVAAGANSCTLPKVCDNTLPQDSTYGQCISTCTVNSCPNSLGCLSSGLCGSCTSNTQCPTDAPCDLTSGLCKCSYTAGQITLCSNGQVCTSNGTCQNCTSNSCPTTGASVCNPQGICQDSCKTDPAVCSPSQACNQTTGACGADCNTAGFTCSSGQTCGGSGACEPTCTTTTGCASGFVCTNGACTSSTTSTSCGNGVLEPSFGELCDEGSLGKTVSGATCSHNADCGNGLFCVNNICTYPQRGNISGPCVSGVCPQGQICADGTNCSFLEDHMRGNGLGGHCSTNCKFACAVPVTNGGSSPFVASSPVAGVVTGTPPSSVSAALDLLTAGTITTTCPAGAATLVYTLTTAPDTTHCPCGYGLWVANGIYAASSTVTPAGSINIYGGFSGSETSIDDRTDPLLGTPLGQYSFSNTVLSLPSGNAFTLVANTTVLLDGFQIQGSSDTPIVIPATSTAVLKNLRITGNASKTTGGAIRNTGTMTLRDSFISMNNAVTQGGAISHESKDAGKSRISNVTFFGNGFSGVASAPALCTAGTSNCPTGMTCPPGGGFCNTITATATTITPASTVSGGAIAATGTQALEIDASRFNANYAYGNGGAIFSQSPLFVTSSVFTSNWASNAGGGLYLGSSAATLYNLTLVDNAAYTTGGGGIYDERTGSTLINSLLRNNIGLYPVNGTNLAEWGGDRPNSLINQINSISDGMSFSSAGMNGTPSNGILMTKNYVDMCPSISYAPNPSIICDGTQSCGTSSATTNTACPSTFGTSCSFDYNASSNTCNSVEFLDCTAPIYRNCALATSMITQKTFVPGQTPTTAIYKADLHGTFNSGAYAGASQEQCTPETLTIDCDFGASACTNGSCINCVDSSTCQGRFTDTCTSGECVCGTTAAPCQRTERCYQGACAPCVAHEDCATVNPGMPYCVNNACVQCLGSVDCTNPATPKCAKNVCVAN